MPQYQGIWTLAQAAQLQSTQRWATDPLFENTTLLLQADNAANGAQNNTFLDSSSNNFTITRNGNTTQGTFTPYSLQPGAWSNYFEGTTSVLTLGSSADFAVGSVFTIEGWIYPTSAPNSQYVVMGTTGTSAPQVGYNGTTFAVADVGIAWVLNASTNPTVNAWNHFALCRSGTGTNQCSLFLNGVRVANGTVSAAWTTTTGLSIGNTNISTGGFPGYISNIRVVKGTDVYGVSNTTITVPTAPLTPITNTVLLTCQSNRFVDTNTQVAAKIITPSTNAVVQAFSPFAPQYQYTPSVTGGSGYFDGSGDYLNYTGTNLNLGTGAFTAEGWIYQTVRGYVSIIATWPFNNIGNGFMIGVDNTGLPQFYTGNATSPSTYTLVQGTTAIPLNAWVHIAGTKAAGSGGTMTLYVNGVSVGTPTATTRSLDQTSTVLGRYYTNAAGNELTGYISSVRVSNTVRTITVPTAPYTSDANTLGLFNFTNAAITDGTLKNNLETFGNAQVSTSVVKYGTGSMYFDGTGDQLVFPNSENLNIVRGNFTVECWVYLTGSTGSIINYTNGQTNNNNFAFELYQLSSSTIYFSIFETTTQYLASSTAFALNTWVHIAGVRNGNTLTVYLNGVAGSTTANVTNVGGNIPAGATLKVSGYNNGTNMITGYVDDLRITKGIARYTANFIPPSVALPRQ